MAMYRTTPDFPFQGPLAPFPTGTSILTGTECWPSLAREKPSASGGDSKHGRGQGWPDGNSNDSIVSAWWKKM